MRAITGKQWLEEFRKRWMLLSAARVLLQSVAFALLLGGVLSYFLGWGMPAFAMAFLVAFALLSFFQRYWAVSLQDVCRYVDWHYPVVEESSELIISDPQNLSGLQNLQRKRVDALLVEQKFPASLYSRLFRPSILLLVSILILVGLANLPQRSSKGPPVEGPAMETTATIKENVPAEITAYTVSITAPAYTRKPVRVQKQFGIRAEQGATADWQIETSAPVKTLAIIWNDKQVVRLRSADQTGRSWRFSKALSTGGFYQLMLDGKKSDLYQVEIIPDQPVAIRLLTPEQHSTIDVGQAQQVGLKLLLHDDYGITDAYISATVASGKGEAVNFKEQKVALQTRFNNQKQIQVTQQLLLNRLGMKPGDELYFYIQARDNHGQ